VGVEVHPPFQIFQLHQEVTYNRDLK
jgi:hypothetical protein